MGAIYGLFIIIGMVLIGFGIVIHKYPDFMWEFSFERRWYVKGGFMNEKIESIRVEDSLY